MRILLSLTHVCESGMRWTGLFQRQLNGNRWNDDALEFQIRNLMRSGLETKILLCQLDSPMQLNNARQYREAREVSLKPDKVFGDIEFEVPLTAIFDTRYYLREIQGFLIPI